MEDCIKGLRLFDWADFSQNQSKNYFKMAWIIRAWLADAHLVGAFLFLIVLRLLPFPSPQRPNLNHPPRPKPSFESPNGPPPLSLSCLFVCPWDTIFCIFVSLSDGLKHTPAYFHLNSKTKQNLEPLKHLVKWVCNSALVTALITSQYHHYYPRLCTSTPGVRRFHSYLSRTKLAMTTASARNFLSQHRITQIHLSLAGMSGNLRSVPKLLLSATSYGLLQVRGSN